MTVAAFFDVDGTLLKSNIVHHYYYLATQQVSLLQRGLTAARLLSLIPYYLLLDRVSRDEFNRLFYQNYRDFSVSQSYHLGRLYFQEKLKHDLFPAAIHQIIQHQQQGMKIALVTGSIDCIMLPIAEFLNADELLTTRMEVVGDRYTGEILGDPVAQMEKVRLIQVFAAEQGIDLARSYAYGDSIGDLPMLKLVGHPVAINPSTPLKQVATRLGWNVKYWQSQVSHTDKFISPTLTNHSHL
jgi:HAD superfamily hydrolase (TIGR01490 family)